MEHPKQSRRIDLNNPIKVEHFDFLELRQRLHEGKLTEDDREVLETLISTVEETIRVLRGSFSMGW